MRTMLLTLLLGASLAARQAAKLWITYTPPSGKFTALFPVEPKSGHEITKTGNLSSNVYTYGATENEITFLVGYQDLDPKSSPSADASLQNAHDHLLEEGGGKLLTSRRSEFVRGPNDKLPMMEFTGINFISQSVKGEYIYDGFTNYTVMTSCPKGKEDSPAITTFFSSFKLNPTARQANDTWVKFTSSEGRFSALFPVAPIADRKVVNTQGQTIQVNNFIVTVDGMILGVTYTDYDPKTTYPVESGMKTEQDTLLKGLNATLLTSARSEFPRGPDERLPSLEFTGASEDRNLKGIVIVDALRVYIVAFICPKTKDGSAASDKLFSSFKLLPKK